MFYYYCKKNLTELTVRFSRGLYMILEFEEIGRIDVEEVFYKDGDYILSGRDKRKVERKLWVHIALSLMPFVSLPSSAPASAPE